MFPNFLYLFPLQIFTQNKNNNNNEKKLNFSFSFVLIFFLIEKRRRKKLEKLIFCCESSFSLEKNWKKLSPLCNSTNVTKVYPLLLQLQFRFGIWQSRKFTFFLLLISSTHLQTFFFFHSTKLTQWRKNSLNSPFEKTSTLHSTNLKLTKIVILLQNHIYMCILLLYRLLSAVMFFSSYSFFHTQWTVNFLYIADFEQFIYFQFTMCMLFSSYFSLPFSTFFIDFNSIWLCRFLSPSCQLYFSLEFYVAKNSAKLYILWLRIWECEKCKIHLE